MDLELLTEISARLESMFKAANDLPGSVAFVLGVVSWFLVEKAIRHLGDLMRGALIIALIALSGISSIALINFFMSNGEDKEQLLPQIQSTEEPT